MHTEKFTALFANSVVLRADNAAELEHLVIIVHAENTVELSLLNRHNNQNELRRTQRNSSKQSDDCGTEKMQELTMIICVRVSDNLAELARSLY